MSSQLLFSTNVNIADVVTGALRGGVPALRTDQRRGDTPVTYEAHPQLPFSPDELGSKGDRSRRGAQSVPRPQREQLPIATFRYCYIAVDRER
jgi:hypothetical protein